MVFDIRVMKIIVISPAFTVEHFKILLFRIPHIYNETHGSNFDRTSSKNNADLLLVRKGILSSLILF